MQLLAVWLVAAAALALAGSADSQQQQHRQPGIVVQKHSNIISGLNQQFRQRPHSTTTTTTTTTTSASTSSTTSWPISSSGSGAPEAAAGGRGSPAAGLLSKVWQVGAARRGSASAPTPHPSNQAHLQSLYLDRNQQQLLAANPALLEEVGGNLSLALRLGAAAAAAAAATAASDQSVNASGSAGPQQAPPAGGCYSFELASQQQQQQQQLYRGFSLIELEVRSEQDRRYVSGLYGNLSAAINEQAARPAQAGSAPTVSPYVDVDFWSTGLGLSERVDIMVSPKSRAFLLGQLARAKIRHRIKIDDIQARLDQLLAAPASSTASGGAPATAQQVAASSSPAGKLAADLQLSGRQTTGADQTNLSSELPAAAAAAAARADESADTQTGSTQPASAGRPLNTSQFFENYQRLADINQFLETLVELAPQVARVQVIGKSSQGRYLRVLKLGYDQSEPEMPPPATPSNQDQAQQQLRLFNNASAILETFFRRQAATAKLGAIWIDGGTHAREWISPATALFMASRLVENHVKCSKFYTGLRNMVTEHELKRQSQDAALYETLTAPSFEPELLTGINEINSMLLGKPVAPARPRTNFERSMEQLAKKPEQVAAEWGCNLDQEQLLRRYTFWVEPVLNPDGYEYTHTHNRLWRKTRSVSSHPIYRHFCLGADPNRNYDARHGATGSSQHPCSQTFAGAVPFTEPETRHQSNFVYANRLNMRMYITLHAYSQLILLPYSHSRHLAPDHRDLESVGVAAAKAIEKTHGTAYKVGSSASILYTASGTASDWAYEKAGIKYSYTIELRDTGNHGFLLPRQQIVPTGEETFNGLLAMIEQMEKNENLLSSKSGFSSMGPNQLHQFRFANQSAPLDSSGLPNYYKAPLSDNLKSSADQRPRPPLENILDGSNTWAAPEVAPSSVRDRKPQLSASAANQRELIESLGASMEEELSSGGGYAFENDLGPAPEDLVSQVSLREAGRRIEMRMHGRREHSRRITQVAAINSSGRSVINSPALTGNQPASKPRRRESSERMPEAAS